MVSIVGEDIFENSLEEVLGDSEHLKEKGEWVLETLTECEEEKNNKTGAASGPGVMWAPRICCRLLPPLT